MKTPAANILAEALRRLHWQAGSAATSPLTTDAARAEAISRAELIQNALDDAQRADTIKEPGPLTFAARLAAIHKTADDPQAGDFYTRLAAIYALSAPDAAPLDPFTDYATAHAAGEALAELLDLHHPKSYPDRYRTSYGPKTAAGLARSAFRILTETHNNQAK